MQRISSHARGDGRDNGQERIVSFVAKGLLEEGLHWVSNGRKFRVDEIKCVAMGAKRCLFATYKEPIG